MFLVLFCFILVEISEIELVCDLRTDRPTDRRTDIPSYRDARTHLKTYENNYEICLCLRLRLNEVATKQQH